MNTTFDSMMGAMGFNRVNTKPCSECSHAAKTIDPEILACMYWNAFTNQSETCSKWEAK